MMRTENCGDGSLAAQNTTTTILLAGGVIDESNRGERYGQPALSWWSCLVPCCGVYLRLFFSEPAYEDLAGEKYGRKLSPIIIG